MKMLVICSSPRREGNTEILLDKAVEGAKSAGAVVEKLYLDELNVSPCQLIEYYEVDDEGFSVIKDDIHIVFQKIKESDILLIGAPIYFGSIPGQLKVMIDRFQCVWLSRHIFKKTVFPKKRKGGFICTSAVERKDFFVNAKAIIRHFYKTINVDYEFEIFCPGVDEKGKVLEFPEMINEALELGKKLLME